MLRREFGGTVAAAAATPLAAAPRRRNTAMHVGGDYHSVVGGGSADMSSKENIEYNLRFGVKHLTIRAPKKGPDGGWDADDLKRIRDNCDRLGMTLEAIRMDPDYITQVKGPGRERELQKVIGNVAKAGAVGVKVITHHWTVIPIRRNEKRPGRGGSVYASFKLETNWRDLPVGPSGKVSSAEYWDRIGYFLEKVIPVCKQHDVRMACHPYDPPGLPFGYQGAENWDSPGVFEAIKKYEAIVDSPYNGFQLCLGTVGEGLKNPARDVLPVVKYLGEKGKIHQIHMRNITGGLGDFAEVYPDEGVMNFFEVMRILRDTGFGWSICPDHMPHHHGDPGGLQAFAFGYGYVKALIQSVNSEVS